jgi:hypothetical protein
MKIRREPVRPHATEPEAASSRVAKKEPFVLEGVGPDPFFPFDPHMDQFQDAPPAAQEKRLRSEDVLGQAMAMRSRRRKKLSAASASAQPSCLTREASPRHAQQLSVSEGATITGGRYIELRATDRDDDIRVEKDGHNVKVIVNDETFIFDESKYDQIVLNAAGGDDHIDVAADLGDKLTIWGGAGNDTIRVSGGNNRIEGQEGDDVIYGGTGNDWIEGGEGNDRIDGGGGVNTIYGDGGDDTISGGPGDDFISGGAGRDTLAGGGGRNQIYASRADGDVVLHTSGKDTVGMDRW